MPFSYDFENETCTKKEPQYITVAIYSSSH